jgi:putative hydrolase of the HAD superfamily
MPTDQIKAITFDLWDTLVHDDSDEPKRKAQGLLSKKQQRRQVVWEALDRHGAIEHQRVSQAYDVADAAFNQVWHNQHVTWPITTRLEVLLQGLQRTLPESELSAIVRAHEVMEIDIPPDLIAGCAEALQELSERYQLAIVSDAIVSPGRCLRQLLEKHGILKYFTGFAFSDEVGHSKPHRRMFDTAARQLGTKLPEMVHIGDRDHNDIQGPHALGMKAILFTASRDVDKDNTKADAICDDYRQLPGIIEELSVEC